MFYAASRTRIEPRSMIGMCRSSRPAHRAQPTCLNASFSTSSIRQTTTFIRECRTARTGDARLGTAAGLKSLDQFPAHHHGRTIVDDPGVEDSLKATSQSAVSRLGVKPIPTQLIADFHQRTW